MRGKAVESDYGRVNGSRRILRFRNCRRFGNQRLIRFSRPGVARLPPQMMLVTEVVGCPLAFIRMIRLIVGNIIKLVTCRAHRC